MNVLVTGGAGFIGTYLIEELLKKGNKVISVDNFTLGKKENALKFKENKNYKFLELDIDNKDIFCKTLKDEKIDIIYHLAANSDIKKGGSNPSIDYRDTFMTTISVLELMKQNNIKNLFFASTSAIYGEKEELLKEDIGGLFPISYYGGSKLASENFISAYAHMNDLNVVIFRFPNVVGPNLTHGVIFDFVKKLNNNNKELEILGNGKQTKEYLYITDLLEAILLFTSDIKKGIEIFNVGSSSNTSVTEIADIVKEELNLKNVIYKYTGGKGGWKGDVPYFRYDLTKIHNLGWKAKYTSNQAVRKAVRGHYESSYSSRG